MILSEILPTKHIIEKIQCDSCQKIDDDSSIIAEYLIYEDCVGYFGKPFRDGDHIELHLCPQCKYDILGKYIRTISNNFDY